MKLEGRQAELEAEYTRTERELSDALAVEENTAEHFASLREFMDKLNAEPENVDLRLKTRQALRQVINVIHVYPVAVPENGLPEGWEPHDQEESDWLVKMTTDRKANKAGRYLRVYFRGGGFRVLCPDREDPLVHEMWPRKKG